MLFLYFSFIFIFAVYSFSLIDPNITFFQTNWWVLFREKLIYLGYYRRDLSWMIYFFMIIFLFISHYLLLRKYKEINPIRIAGIIGGILLFSYPFLSHDFLNYMFDAKIITVYQQNPYLRRAMDFPNDSWLRFMHWTHRTYPYGPIFLLITLFPSFLSFGKFVLSFFFLKATFIIFYLTAVYFLSKIDKRSAVYFATHPLVIIEGLINSHNDLIAVALGIVAAYCLVKNKQFNSRLLFILSAGIKYLSFPALFLIKSGNKWNKLVFALLLGLVVYLSVRSEVQPWYFLNFFIFSSFLFQLIRKLDIFYFGLLMSYYPYIRFGGWDSFEKVSLKHSIIIWAAFANLAYLVILNRKKILFQKK